MLIKNSLCSCAPHWALKVLVLLGGSFFLPAVVHLYNRRQCIFLLESAVDVNREWVFASTVTALWIIHWLFLLQQLRSVVASNMFKVSGFAISYKYILDNININFLFIQPWFKKNTQNQTGKRKFTAVNIVAVHWVLLRLNTKHSNIIVFLPASKMINLSVPDTIDERAINKKKLTPFIIQV